MHPALRGLAKELGIPLSSRSCSNGWMWNGRDLATNQGAGWEDTEEWDPLRPLPDEWLAHEIGHWVAAEDYQRDLPEYGLGLVITFMCQGGLSVQEQEWLVNGVVDEQESLVQECAADILGIFFCSTRGIYLLPAQRWEWSRYASPVDAFGAPFNDPSAPERVEPALRLLERKYPEALVWFQQNLKS